jgi:hypothetical protein
MCCGDTGVSNLALNEIHDIPFLGVVHYASKSSNFYLSMSQYRHITRVHVSSTHLGTWNMNAKRTSSPIPCLAGMIAKAMFSSSWHTAYTYFHRDKHPFANTAKDKSMNLAFYRNSQHEVLHSIRIALARPLTVTDSA